MKVLYFDCSSGITGNMAIGSLLDLGIDTNDFLLEMNKLNLGGYSFCIEKEQVNETIGTRFDINISCCERPKNLSDVKELIMESGLCTVIKEKSIGIIHDILKAEARVRNKGIDELDLSSRDFLHLLLEIIGCLVCIKLLKIERVYSSLLYDGKGFADINGSLFPVPMPVVLEMLKDAKIPVINHENENALITPAGLGLIKNLAVNFGNMPAFIIDCVGYGISSKNEGRKNTLRAVLGDLYGTDELVMEEMAFMETSLEFANCNTL